MDIQAAKETILEATLKMFYEKGLKFTMSDIAVCAGMSKRTIYMVFADKESLFYAMVDYCFDKIKDSEKKVLEDASLDTVGKIRAILSVLPEGYREKSYTVNTLGYLKEKYPKIYRRVEERLESGWENTIALIEQGIAEGVVRPVNIAIYKVMLEATIEQFFQRDVLVSNQISYADALDEVVGILVDGITVKC